MRNEIMKKQNGLSLVELMISITLGLLLMSGVTQMFVSSKTVFGTQQGLSRIQETGRLALEFISRDLRQASYYGCVRTINPAAPNTYNLADITGSSATLHGSFTEGIRGYNSAANLPHGTSVDLGASITPTPSTGSDILVIRGATERGLPISSANTATSVAGYTTATATTTFDSNTCVDGLCVNGIAAISDCSKGVIFKVTGISLSSNTVTVGYSSATALAASQYARGDILPVHTTVYFLANSAVNSAEPSLWQKIDNQAPIELLQGVENMRIKYSTDLITYRRAGSVTNWNDVKSVSIELLVRGTDVKSLADRQPYTFDGTTTTPTGTDYRIRQVFSTNLSVRTRYNGI